MNLSYFSEESNCHYWYPQNGDNNTKQTLINWIIQNKADVEQKLYASRQFYFAGLTYKHRKIFEDVAKAVDNDLKTITSAHHHAIKSRDLYFLPANCPSLP